MINKVFSIKFSLLLIPLIIISFDALTKQNDSGDSSIIPIVTIAANYPKAAAINKIEGFVTLQFTVNERGSVEQPEVMESQPEGVFDTEATKAILKYKFKPARVNNKFVKQKAMQTIEFKLSALNQLDDIAHNAPQADDFKNYDIRYSTNKDKKYYRHSLIIRNKSTHVLIKEMDLSSSYKKAGGLYLQGDSKYVFFYSETKNSKAKIEIINLESLAFIHEIYIDKKTITKYDKQNHSFYAVGKDGNHLLLQVGKGRNQKIINIDAESGQIVKEISLGKSKILVKTSNEYNYFWTRNAKTSSGNRINIFRSDTLEKINSIKIDGKISSITSDGNIIHLIEKQIDIKNPENNKFRVKIIDVTNNRIYDEYTSSIMPKLLIVNEKALYLMGRSLEKPKYLKIVKLENEEFTDISNTTIDMIIEKFDSTITNDEQIIVLFGEKSVVRFDLLNPEKSSYIATPFKIEGGIVSKNTQRVYVNANFGAQVGLVDFTTGKFVGSDHTGSKGKKVGSALLSLMTMAVTAPTGYMLIPGVKLSQNALMLSRNQKNLFALNSKTNDVTVFNAHDLSNKKIYPTGKLTFQIIQTGAQQNSPVVVISQNQATYFDANNGEQVFIKRYDNFIKVTDDLNLVYQLDNSNEHIPLYEIPTS